MTKIVFAKTYAFYFVKKIFSAKTIFGPRFFIANNKKFGLEKEVSTIYYLKYHLPNILVFARYNKLIIIGRIR
jgi:hypothetical protein